MLTLVAMAGLYLELVQFQIEAAMTTNVNFGLYLIFFIKKELIRIGGLPLASAEEFAFFNRI